MYIYVYQLMYSEENDYSIETEKWFCLSRNNYYTPESSSTPETP